MEKVMDISKFYEIKGDNFNVCASVDTNVIDEVVEEEVFSEFAQPAVKSLTKILALTTDTTSIRKYYPEIFERNEKVCFPREKKRSKAIKRRARAQAKLERQILEEENNIRMEILQEDYEQLRVQKECDEMFKLYNQKPEFELVLDLQLTADENE